GRSPQEVLGRHISLLVPTLEQGLFIPSPSGWGTAHGRRELEGQRADGSRFPLELSISVGEVHRRRTSALIVRDLTEAKQVEEALNRERNLLHGLMDSVPDR